MRTDDSVLLIAQMVCSWTESIAQKVKRKKKVEDNSRKVIWHSVFAPKVEATFPEEVQVCSTFSAEVRVPDEVHRFRSRRLTTSLL